jgi:uncharacterized membrane protein (UPF0127 family)
MTSPFRFKAMLLAASLAASLAVPAAAACPNAGLKERPATITTARGKFSFVLELAQSPQEQECGLMFRASMPAGHGMVFPFRPARETAFWMENTPLPLDLIFVGARGRVLRVAQGQPFSRALIESGGVASAVVELNAGEAARIGLKPGDRVTY